MQTSRGLGIEVRDNSSDGRPGIFVKALTPKGAAALVSSSVVLQCVSAVPVDLEVLFTI